jgi:predicted Zn-dependent protease
MRSIFSVLLLAAVAGAYHLPAQQRDPDKGVNFYSIEKEIALGRQLAAEVTRDRKPLESPAALSYITALGQRLAAHLGGPQFTYTFALFNDNTPYTQAIALPGGFVFVPSSIILAAQDEDELAGILAHSLAHIVSRHGTKSATRAELVNTASQPLIYMGGWAGYAMRQGAGLAIPLGFLDMYRKQDLAADRLAVTAMSVAGYNPAALGRYLARELPRFENPKNAQFSPLPPLDQRLQLLGAATAELPPQAYASHTGLAPIQDEIRRIAIH